MTTRFGWLGLSSAMLLAMGVPASGDPPVDVILEWNAVAMQVNTIDHTGPDLPGNQLSDTQGPPASVRVLALVHAAMFEAYNTIDPKYTSYLGQPIPSEPGASIDAAVAQAAHDVFFGLFPGSDAPRPAIRDFVDQALQTTLNRVNSSPKREKGIAVGAFVAAQLLSSRAFDGPFLNPASTGPGAYVPTGAPGKHNVDPKNADQSFISPRISGLPPFGNYENLPSGETFPEFFRAPPPPALTSSEYAAAFVEVEALGEFRGGNTGAFAPTTDPTYVIANYWSYNGSPFIGTPPRLYNQMARVIAVQQQNEVHENARLFALLNIAMGDGGISSWDSKYSYAYWRPILGIRKAHKDGNPDTKRNRKWCALGGSRSNPFLIDGVLENNFTPPFPAYTSGHATFGAAAFKTLANFYQTDDISFRFISDEWNGSTRDQFNRVRPLVPRSFPSLSYAAAENAASRVFNGVHWRFDGTEGVRAGNGIADEVFDNLLRPLGGGGTTSIEDEEFEAQIDAILTTTPTGP